MIGEENNREEADRMHRIKGNEMGAERPDYHMIKQLNSKI